MAYRERFKNRFRYYIFRCQAVYYLLTGVWSITNIMSFMAITGPKTDIWLVRMVGLLSISISIQLFAQLLKRTKPTLLALLTASSFLTVDTIYALN